MYEHLAEQAREAGLELTWSPRIAYSRTALAAAEAVRVNEPQSHQAFNAAIFRAYFALGLDIGDWSVITKCAVDVGIDPSTFESPMTSGVADDRLRHAEAEAREHRVDATPSWLVENQLVVGLRPRAFFVTLAQALAERRPRP